MNRERLRGLPAFLDSVFSYPLVSRHAIHAILNRLSSDTLVARMARAREDERFKAIGPDALVLVSPASQSSTLTPLVTNGIGKEHQEGEVWLDWEFVEFWKSNFCG